MATRGGAPPPGGRSPCCAPLLAGAAPPPPPRAPSPRRALRLPPRPGDRAHTPLRRYRGDALSPPAKLVLVLSRGAAKDLEQVESFGKERSRDEDRHRKPPPAPATHETPLGDEDLADPVPVPSGDVEALLDRGEGRVEGGGKIRSSKSTVLMVRRLRRIRRTGVDQKGDARAEEGGKQR